MKSKSKGRAPYFMMEHIYIRLGPAKIQELKQDRQLTKEEARAICRQISPAETVAHVLGNFYSFAQCTRIGMESSMQLARMLEEIMLKAIVMGVKPRPRDKRSWLAYRSWVEYFKEKGFIKVQ